MANRTDGFRLRACVWISSETLEAAWYRYKMQKVDKFETSFQVLLILLQVRF